MRRVAGVALFVIAAVGAVVVLTNDDRDRGAAVLIGGLIVGGVRLLRTTLGDDVGRQP